MDQDNHLAPPRAELPAELLLEIFELATYIPGAYTHSDQQAFVAFTQDHHGISIRRRHREATDTMLSASCVCKSWYPLALEFLFKYILIKSGAHAVEIASALIYHASRAASGVLSMAPGRKAVRLELGMEGNHVWTKHHYNALEHIMIACPCLSVISTAFTVKGFLTHRFFRTMQFARNLRRLELAGNIVPLREAIHWLPRDVSRSLEALWLQLTPAGTRLELLHPVVSPRLRHLVMSGSCTAPSSLWTMPVLRTLCIDPDSPLFDQRSGSEAFNKYLTGPGAQLQYFSAKSYTHLGVRLCPNLSECTLTFVELKAQFPHSFPTSPSLRCINIIIKLCNGAPAGGALHLGVTPLTTWLLEGWDTGRLPSLKAVRFLVPLQQHALVRPERDLLAIRTLMKECKARGVNLMASVGADEHTADIWRPLAIEHMPLGTST
ncbi:hypothetical protein C8Q74DRAFT_86502 [Fomes fomentarius]|nr:hypothetical protein C8Q74DRAFT_86502 [Fomes fomentarius]